MLSRRIMVTVLLQLLPVVIDSSNISSTCTIASVKAGENATLTIQFGKDLSNERAEDFSLMHIHKSKEQTVWGCRFSHGDVHTCSNIAYYSWDRKVTDVFRVYIHNVSQEHEGTYFGLILPSNSKIQLPCIFKIKAVHCSTDSINRSNGYLSCNNQSVSVGQTCTVTCNPGHYFQENQTSVNYTCVEENKWSPEMVTICEVKSDEATNVTAWKTTEQSDCLNCSPFKTSMIIFIIGFVITLFAITGVTIKCCKRMKMKRSKKAEQEEQEELTLKNWEEKKTDEENYWLRCIRTWYPKLFEQTYFLPSHPKNISQPVTQMTETGVHNDNSLQRVLHGIRELEGNYQKKEVMFVLSQLQFGKYQGKPSFAPAVNHLPHLNTFLEDNYQRCFDEDDYDVLIIHRQHGLFILQISSVRGNCIQQEENGLTKKVKEMTEKLSKAEYVLRQFMSTLNVEINITKCLAMPNIKYSQLRTIIGNRDEQQDTRNCLGAQRSADALKLILLSDHLTDDQIPSCLHYCFRQNFKAWWRRVIKASGPQLIMTTSLYDYLVARFCGPATTREIYRVTAPRLNMTLGEGVSETRLVSRIVLFPRQVDILNRPQPGVFLSGPPGTGKSIVLIIQGLTWIQLGYDVHVVSTCDESYAVTLVIEHQLQETAETPTARSRVHTHHFDFREDGQVEAAVNCLSKSKGGHLCIIADEVVNECREYFKQFVNRLTEEVPGVYIWGASTYQGITPQYLKEINLTTSLRSPSGIVKEVTKSVEIKRKLVHDYTVSDFRDSKDDPPVIRIKHKKGTGHTGDWPHDCTECGRQVASVLTNLNVKRTLDGCGENNGPPPLQFRDVLVLCANPPAHDQMSTSYSLVQGLRESAVPVFVVNRNDKDTIRRVALGVDMVAVAHWDDVHGLERNVVVVESGIGIDMASERLYAMSRCISHLVLIEYRPKL